MKEVQEFLTMRDGWDYKYYMGGIWKVSSSETTIPIKNPYNDDLVGNIQACTKQEVDEMVKITRDNIDCWENTPIRERSEILRKAANLMIEWAEPLGTILMKEIGKPIKSAISEIKRTADIFNATADASSQIIGETIMGDTFEGFTREKLSITYRVPIGIVLCIGPFNYPFNLTGSKIAPALAAGNAVIMKPPTQGAITSLHFGVILEKAGVPPGVFNIITGRGSDIGDYLVAHPMVDMISFTGSSETGRNLAKVAGMKPLLLELEEKMRQLY